MIYREKDVLRIAQKILLTIDPFQESSLDLQDISKMFDQNLLAHVLLIV